MSFLTQSNEVGIRISSRLIANSGGAEVNESGFILVDHNKIQALSRSFYNKIQALSRTFSRNKFYFSRNTRDQ